MQSASVDFGEAVRGVRESGIAVVSIDGIVESSRVRDSIRRNQLAHDTKRDGILEINRLETLSRESDLFRVAKLAQSVFSGIAKCDFAKAWAQTSTTESTEDASDRVPFLPHLDYVRYLKAMWYLVDVNRSNGAFHVAPERPDDNEPLRLSLTPGYKERGENVLRHRDEADFVPVEANAGTLLLFDTNVPHFAGPISSSRGERMIVRFDFAVPAWDRSQS